MKIRCIAVDDEPMALEKLGNYISKVPYLELVASCEDAFAAMNVISSEKVDAVFIDVNMPDVNGLEFIRSLPDPPLTVFITAYPEYAVDSYKVRAVDYLLKPYDFEDFQRAAGNVFRRMELMNGRTGGQTEPGVIYMKVDYRYIRVKLDDVIYVEGMNEYLKVCTCSAEPFLTHTTFRQLNANLPDNFLQVHRSYVINMKHVKAVERSMVLMSDGTRVPVSDGSRDGFMQYLQNHSLKK